MSEHEEIIRLLKEILDEVKKSKSEVHNHYHYHYDNQALQPTCPTPVWYTTSAQTTESPYKTSECTI